MPDYLKDAEDIARFCDPFTESKIKRTDKSLSVYLVRNGRQIIYEIDQVSGKVSSKSRRSVFSDVNSLLASEDFANLQQLAKTQLRAHKKESRAIPACLILNGAKVDDAVLCTYVDSKCDGLRLMLIDGAAGVGKTFQILNLVASQAARVEKEKATPPVLHLSSKGRRLSNLNDVLASSTQELATSFRAAHVATLVRRGLLVVAIDGFDELVDADGYEDSWSALRSFISDVGDQGTILLAARDTFVEEQELLDKIKKNGSEIDFSLLHVRPPTSQAAIEWLAQSPSWKLSDIKSPLTADFLAEGSYALRPFFLRELQEVKGWAEVIDCGPRTFLVNRLLRREALLIAQQLGGVKSEDLLPKLRFLLQEVALEMGAREIDWVEVEHLGYLTEYCFEDLLNEASRRKLVHKSGSFAFLEVGMDGGKRVFPHSEIKSFFLGYAIMSSVSREVLPSVLRRAVLSAEHMEAFAEVFNSWPAGLRKISDFLGVQYRAMSSADSFSANIGSILITMSGLGVVDRLDYADIIDATFAGGVPDLTINESRLGRVDARGANLRKLKLVHTVIDTLVVDSATAFGAEIAGVENIEIRNGESVEMLKGAARVDDYILNKVKESDAVPVTSESLELFDRIVRRIIRHHYLRERGGDDEGTFLLQDPRWPFIKSVLEKHGRLEVIKRPMKGVSSNLIRISRAGDFLDVKLLVVSEILAEIASGP